MDITYYNFPCKEELLINFEKESINNLLKFIYNKINGLNLLNFNNIKITNIEIQMFNNNIIEKVKKILIDKNYKILDIENNISEITGFKISWN